jgi:RimJ/RimL family protein N-acetyltransferase
MRLSHDGFETARLRMRRLCESDESLYCDLYTDADTMRFICAPWSRERAARNFRKVLARSLQPSSPKYFAMLDRASQRCIGLCAIQQPDAEMQRAEVGMMLNSDARGQGYATEAFAALITTAFLALPIDTVWVQYHPANTAAERLFIGLGFLPAADAAIGDLHRAQRTRTMLRSAWSALNSANTRGEDNVERHQFS